ncbi:flagellar hook protein FlgE [Salinarimonas soli]|uniref:Flagellar hook protein FlgE n=1 Tax=Salinarimonas soli TaxID=1638099 RepID=A0A5B2V8Q3_9HYPH|nr:flagellar hook protein FlgE [Salinarimonas soli]KAA2234709.1 flagellar hook protein FlgE [Salinarimonas soli]
MSLYGVMRTGVSGMSAQSTKLATVADNIANANTNGYKRAETQFSSMILDSEAGSYTSGGVTPNVRYAISQQGALQFTTSSTDLAVQGNGFFVVSDGTGTPFLTRAGSFVKNSDGELVNAGGFKLMGAPITDGVMAPLPANSMASLVPVTLNQLALEATPSTAGQFAANLPANSAFNSTVKSSLVAYDNLGNRKTINLTFTNKTPDVVPPAVRATGSWEVSATVDGTTSGPFAIGFDTFGQSSGLGAFSITIPGGATLDLDMNGSTQVAAPYTVLRAAVNGNAPSAVRDVEISTDGTVFAIMEDGTRKASFRIPLADVPSPDRMKPLAGNVYAATMESGDVQIGLPENGGLGKVVAGAVEQSNVDLAGELTAMIEAQRNYTANSKTFQTGSDLLELLVNLKR